MIIGWCFGTYVFSWRLYIQEKKWNSPEKGSARKRLDLFNLSRPIEEKLWNSEISPTKQIWACFINVMRLFDPKKPRFVLLGRSLNFITFLQLVARDETNLTVSLRSLFQGNFITFLEWTKLQEKTSTVTSPYDLPLGIRFLTNRLFHVVAHQKLYKTPYRDLIAISNC